MVSGEETKLNRRIKDMSLKPLMSMEITSLPSTATILDAAKFMTDMNVGSVIIMKDDIPSAS
jgi:CBS domain-containing protein